MRRLTSMCCAILTVACGSAEQAADTAAAAGEAVGTATLSAADVQGRWSMQNTLEGGEGTGTPSQLDATGDPSTWKLTLPNREPMSVTVSFDADSMIMESPTFESVLRPGVQVTTRTVTRMENGQLVGRTTARYATTGADSVAYLRTVGTRAN